MYFFIFDFLNLILQVQLAEELASMKLHNQASNTVQVNGELQKVASACGECGEIKFLDARTWRESKSQRINYSPEGKTTQMAWSADGQLFTFATANGFLHCYLAKLTSLFLIILKHVVIGLYQ